MSECQDPGRKVVNRELRTMLFYRPEGALGWCTHAAPSYSFQGQGTRSSGPLLLMFGLECRQAIPLPFKRHVFPFALQTPSSRNKPQYVLDPLALVAPLPKKPQVGQKREKYQVRATATMFLE